MPSGATESSSRIVPHRPAIFRLTWLGLVSEWFQTVSISFINPQQLYQLKQFGTLSCCFDICDIGCSMVCVLSLSLSRKPVHGFPGPGCKPSVAATQWALEGGTTTEEIPNAGCFDEIRMLAMLAMLAMLLMPSMLSFQRLTFDTFREPVVSLRSTPCCHVSPEELKGSNTTYRDGTRLRSRE